MLSVFKGIHSNAVNDWIVTVYNNYPQIQQAQTMNDRLRILQDLANHINGIGDAVVQKTLAEIESQHY
jgi:hypothetical protein